MRNLVFAFTVGACAALMAGNAFALDSDAQRVSQGALPRKINLGPESYVSSILVDANYVYSAGENVMRYDKSHAGQGGVVLAAEPAYKLLGIVGQDLYYLTAGSPYRLMKINRLGGTPTEITDSNLSNPNPNEPSQIRAMVADSQFIYFAVDATFYVYQNNSPGKIVRVDRNSGESTVLATDTRAVALLLLKGKLYWSNSKEIKRVSLANTDEVKTVRDGGFGIFDLATDGMNVFWADYDQASGHDEWWDGQRFYVYTGFINKLSPDGVVSTLTSGIENLNYNLAADQNSVYWSTVRDRVYKVSVKGFHRAELVADGVGYKTNQVDIAVDSTSLYVGSNRGTLKLTPN